MWIGPKTWPHLQVSSPIYDCQIGKFVPDPTILEVKVGAQLPPESQATIRKCERVDWPLPRWSHHQLEQRLMCILFLPKENMLYSHELILIHILKLFELFTLETWCLHFSHIIIQIWLLSHTTELQHSLSRLQPRFHYHPLIVQPDIKIHEF